MEMEEEKRQLSKTLKHVKFVDEFHNVYLPITNISLTNKAINLILYKINWNLRKAKYL